MGYIPCNARRKLGERLAVSRIHRRFNKAGLAALEPLPRKGWSRTARVSGAGPMYQRTLLYYAERLARHERAHVKQIGRMVKTLET